MPCDSYTASGTSSSGSPKLGKLIEDNIYAIGAVGVAGVAYSVYSRRNK
jgi:hypothetical protein